MGITAGLECFTTGDLGACSETALNVASMFVGGRAGKIAVKYGLRWGKAAELGRRIAELGGELIGGVNGLIRANRKVDNLCSPGNSFVPGTRVVMADGSTRPIEEVDVGEKVLATDPETGERTARTVLATIIGSGSKHLVEITVDPTTERTVTGGNTGSEVEDEQVEQSGIPGPVAAGDVIIATDEHPFWVPDLGQWVDAVDLAPGTWLQTSSGTWVQVSAVQAWTQPATVHNLTVQGVHTFHVAVGDLNILNHNCEPAFLDGVSEKYVRDKHTESGSMRDETKGYFYDSEDLYELADRSESFGVDVQLNGNCVRVCDAGRLVGCSARRRVRTAGLLRRPTPLYLTGGVALLLCTPGAQMILPFLMADVEVL
ncbi:HINT domain-containing protein [Nocardiopsis sp. ARC36]